MKLSLKSQNLGVNDWYYEYRGGIEIIHQVLINGEFYRTDIIKISWRKLRASLKRKDAK